MIVTNNCWKIILCFYLYINVYFNNDLIIIIKVYKDGDLKMIWEIWNEQIRAIEY